MARISLVGKEADTTIELELIKENKPTPLLIVLVVAEVTLDIAIAYAAYRLFRARDAVR